MGAQKKTTHKKIHTRLEHHNNKKLWCNFSVATKSLNTAAPSRQLGVTFLGFFSAKSRFGSFKFVGWVGKPQLQRLLLSREPGIPPWSFFVFWGKKGGSWSSIIGVFFEGGVAEFCWVWGILSCFCWFLNRRSVTLSRHFLLIWFVSKCKGKFWSVLMRWHHQMKPCSGLLSRHLNKLHTW